MQELCDAAIHQKPARLLSDIYMLAIRNTLTFPGTQTNNFFTRKEMDCSSGVSAVGNIYTHPESMAIIHIIPTTSTRAMPGPVCLRGYTSAGPNKAASIS